MRVHNLGRYVKTEKKGSRCLGDCFPLGVATWSLFDRIIDKLGMFFVCVLELNPKGLMFVINNRIFQGNFEKMGRRHSHVTRDNKMSGLLVGTGRWATNLGTTKFLMGNLAIPSL